MQCAFGLHRVAQRHALNPCHVKKKKTAWVQQFLELMENYGNALYLFTKRINDGLVKTFKINQFDMI